MALDARRDIKNKGFVIFALQIHHIVGRGSFQSEVSYMVQPASLYKSPII